MYSTTNDPWLQMIPRPEMIPKLERKWFRTTNDCFMNNLNLLHRLDHINTITFKIDEKSTPGIQRVFFLFRVIGQNWKPHLKSL